MAEPSSSSDCDYPCQDTDLSRSLPSSTDESSSEAPVMAVSLLSRLKSPTPADLARKRKVRTNPPTGSKKGKGASAADPKNVSAAERVKSYPGECLVVNYNKNLFCHAL